MYMNEHIVEIEGRGGLSFADPYEYHIGGRPIKQMRFILTSRFVKKMRPLSPVQKFFWRRAK